MVTANPNSWTTAQDKILPFVAADALVMQETKLCGTAGVTKVSNQGRANGWNATASMAHRTEADMGSGGCVVAVPRGRGITPHDAVKDGFRHRFHIAWTSSFLKGGIHIGSVYLRDSEGLSADNLTILQEVAAVVSQLRGPWVLGGDWNMTPQLLETTNWLRMVQGVVVAPTAPTCNGSTYDFFVVSAGLRPAVAAVQRLDDAGLHPHWPARLLIRGNARRPMVRRLVRPCAVPGVLPHGPLPQPSLPPGLDEPASMAEDLATATALWYDTARVEWSSLAAADAKHAAPRFRWQPSAGPTAAPQVGSGRASATWRSLAQRIEECVGILGRRRPGGLRLIERHLCKISGVVAAGRGLEEALPAIRAWRVAVFEQLLKGDLVHVQRLTAIARGNARVLEARARAKGLADWRQWLSVPAAGGRAGPAAPSRGAYQWIRGLAGWTRSPVGDASLNEAVPCGDAAFDDDGGGAAGEGSHEDDHQDVLWSRAQSDEVPLCDQADVEAEADQWAKLWQESGTYCCPFTPGEVQVLAPLAAPAIRSAALSFPPHTGVGCDNVAPRAVARLSDEALGALGRLLMACELVGDWGHVVRLVLIVLLPKPDGGRRPIGLFPTTIRIWMRARSHLAKEFEARTRSPSIFGGAGMGAQRAAWQVAFQAEAAALRSEHYAQSLLDLVKAFEKVPHRRLAQAARKHGYNVTVLRLTLAAYRLPRSIGVSGIYSRMVVACCGITAGSGFATVELRVLLLDVIKDTYRVWPNIRLALMVDDLTIDADGDEVDTRTAVAGATDLVVGKLEGELELEVSLKKSVVVGSRYQIALAIARTSRTGKLKGARATKLLGTPSGGGRRRSTRALANRLSAFKRKIPRIHSLRKAGVRAQQVTRAAGTPAVTYGVEVVGMAETPLHATRAAVARAAAPEGAGKNPDLVLWSLDGTGGSLDPAFDAHVLPIKFWALAVWQRWRPHYLLARALRAGQRKLAQGRGPAWSKVAGPAAAVVLSAARLGWAFDTPFRLRTDIGQVLELLADSPDYVAAAVKDAVRRWRLQRIAQFFPQSSPAAHDWAANGSDRDGADVMLDFVDSLAPLLRGARGCRDFAPWTVHCRPALLSAICGGQWPQARLASVRDWTDDNRCQLCFGSAGTLLHRHCCPATLPPGGWPAPPEGAQRFLGTLGAHRHELLETRGMLLLRVRLPRPEPGDTFIWEKAPEQDIPSDAKWYIDGSLFDRRWALMRRTGFGVVVVSVAGDLLACGRGLPPSWVRDAAGAEAWALACILRLEPGTPDTTTDCLNLLQGLRRGRAIATDASCGLARVWSHIFAALDDDARVAAMLEGLRWMPAHGAQHTIARARKSDGDVVTPVDWRANRLADALAKRAAAEHRAPHAVRRLAADAAAASAYMLAKLGAVTYAANNFMETVWGDNGESFARRRRDTTACKPTGRSHTGGPRPPRRTPRPGAPAAPTVQQLSLVPVAPDARRVAPPRARKRRGTDVEALRELAFQAAWHGDRAQRELVRAPEGSAAARLAALAARVRARVAYDAPRGA